MHNQASEYAGKTVRIKAGRTHPQVENFGGCEILIEDWWDRVSGSSWAWARGNPACLVYAVRTGITKHPVPGDDEVLYGHMGGLGHLVHISEIEPIDKL
jgi:hypothetical protein